MNGFKQDPIDGVSMAYTFADAKAPGRKKTQYFENNASRGIYHDGWFACTFGPLVPWDTASTAAWLKGWDANKDGWELYDLTKDFSQADDLAAKEPERLAQTEGAVPGRGEGEQGLPHRRRALDCGSIPRTHRQPYTVWRFDATTTRMPEFTAPGLGQARATTSTIDVEVGNEASGVLYALGGAERRRDALHGQGPARLRVQHADHRALHRRSATKLAAGKHRIEVTTALASPSRWRRPTSC